MESCILFKNSTSTIYLIDIPRSIELVQGLSPLSTFKLISTKPPECPFPNVEPKSTKARSRFENSSLKDIVIQKHLEFALDELKNKFGGEWCFERITKSVTGGDYPDRNWLASAQEYRTGTNLVPLDICDSNLLNSDLEIRFTLHRNTQPIPAHTSFNGGKFHIPPNSTILLGSIENTVEIISGKKIQFNIITLDPPWPNRSARRKNHYRVAYNTKGIESLLLQIPITSKLSNEGLVAVWTTNKPAFHSLVLKLFDHWNLNVVEEWIWLKVTKSGDPIFPVSSLWRKPYETLLIGRKVSAVGNNDCDMKRRILIGVPDFHSRKPNLKELIEKTFGFESGTYEGLEIFARSLTMGWWSWGDEVLMFQEERYWTEGEKSRLNENN